MQIRFMSRLESEQIVSLSVRAEIERLKEQVPSVWYDADGRSRTHWFDLVTETRDGIRIAQAVKYEVDILRSGLEAVLLRLSRAASDPANLGAAGRPFADEYRILDEHSVCGVVVDNAELIQRFLGDRDHEAVAAVRAWLSEAPAEFPLHAAKKAAELGFRGMRALVALLASGEVVLREHERIEPVTIFVNRLFNPR
ncbi:hypothetical protein [Jiella sp. M17.18]|uniref:hypothetical protein n=1 Tax=Jiella sp. M17.18 TaxID=3234247 RepID=UPI0034DE1A0E